MTFFNISHLSSFVPRSLPCDSAPSGSILFLHYCFAVRFVLGGGRAYHGLFDLLRTVVHVSCCCLLSIVYCPCGGRGDIASRPTDVPSFLVYLSLFLFLAAIFASGPFVAETLSRSFLEALSLSHVILCSASALYISLCCTSG